MGEELDRRELERLLAIGRGLIARRELDDVLDSVLDAARELCEARYAALGILDHEGEALARFLFVGIDEETRRRIGPLPRGQGILGELIRDPKPLRLERLGEHPHSYGFPQGHPPMTSFLGAPVKIGDQVFGNLYLTEKSGAPSFTDHDEQMLVVLAEWAAIAIDNARSHEALRRHGGRLERNVAGLRATVDLSRQIDGLTRQDRVLELVTKRGRALLESETCIVVLHRDGQLRVADAAGEVPVDIVDEPIGDRRLLETIRSGSVTRLPARIAPEIAATLRLRAEEIVVAPLRARGRELGALLFLDPSSERAIADGSLLLEAFASSAANGIASSRALENERARLSLEAAERERGRWARELHDETLQEMGALRMTLDQAGGDPERLRQTLEGASTQIKSIIDGLQGLLTELRPAALDQLGTEAAVRALCERTAPRAGLEIELDIDLAFERGETTRRHPSEIEAAIYRIVQEALSNIVKHADATQARIVIEERGKRVRITVADDGAGFEVDSRSPQSFGLLGMSERVALLDGELEIRSAPGEGTRITAWLPLASRRL